MAPTRFKYNPTTCRYEPARISIRQILTYCFSLAVMSSLMFAGIAYLQGHFFVTQTTLDLRAENNALKQHFALLSSQLVKLDQSLAVIRDTEKSVESRLFSTPSTGLTRQAPVYRIPEGPHEAMQLVYATQSNAEATIQKAKRYNHVYASSLSLTALDKSCMVSWPTGQPVQKKYMNVASGFGMRINPFHKGAYKHEGLDFAAPQGSPVYATGPGKVIDTGVSTLQAGYGNYIEIEHPCGIITRYAHLQHLSVKQGQWVHEGTIIGTVGMSGGAAAPHLHYEIIKDGEAINPMLYIIKGLTSNEFAQLKSQSEIRNQSLD
ncbi:MAG: M23 family metallopeptidase [Cyclobacteriaceae bacterium]